MALHLFGSGMKTFLFISTVSSDHTSLSSALKEIFRSFTEVKVEMPRRKNTLLQVKVLYQSLIYVNVQKN